MQLELTGPVGQSSPSGEDDVRAVKIALNRLGYYRPDPKLGLNEWTDGALFAAIKDFQTDHHLPPRGEMRSGDETFYAVNQALEKAGTRGHYIWRTARDDHVRAGHAAREGHVFSWADHPRPGEEHGCRCWGEEVEQSIDLSRIDDPPIKPVYPELLLVPALRVGTGMIRIRSIISQILRYEDTVWVARISKERLQHTFKHSKVFGIHENMNSQSLEKLRLAIQNHVKDSHTLLIKGTYHKNPVNHYFNVRTGINVIRGTDGDLVSFWKLSDNQIHHILRNGKLGGN